MCVKAAVSIFMLPAGRTVSERQQVTGEDQARPTMEPEPDTAAGGKRVKDSGQRALKMVVV